MKIIVNRTSFVKAVDYISKNNPYFLNKYNEITETLINLIVEMSEDPKKEMVGTIGLSVVGQILKDDEDNSYLSIDIFVDPGVGYYEVVDLIDLQKYLIFK